MQCETVNMCGLVAVRLNGVVSIYDKRYEQPVKQVINSQTPIEAIVGSFYYNTQHFFGNVVNR